MGSLIKIEASAGSGKTYTLTRIFLELLRMSRDGKDWSRSGCDGEEGREGYGYGWKDLLAITFTNKAAGEMRERLVTTLKEIALKDPASRENDPAMHALWDRAGDHPGLVVTAANAVEALLHDYGRLNMRTIDSLLVMMARLSALELGIPPDFEPCFDMDDITGPIIDGLAEQARHGDQGLQELFSKAMHALARGNDEKGFAAKKIRKRAMEMAGAILALPEKGREIDCGKVSLYAQSFLEDALDTARSLLDALEGEGLKTKRNTLKNQLAKICGAPEQDGRPQTIHDLDLDKIKSGSLAECLDEASQSRASAEACRLYARLRARASDLPSLQRAVKNLPAVMLGQAIAWKAREHMQKKNIVPLSQLPGMLSGLLCDGGRPDAAATLLLRMGTPLAHVLIDEFQDTSSGQWSVLRHLLQESLAQGIASLTLVGDKKQAIYGWRGGDSTLFDSVAEEAPACFSVAGKEPSFPAYGIRPLDDDDARKRTNGRIIMDCLDDGSFARGFLEMQMLTEASIPCNWRSRKMIISWNNALYGYLMQAGNAGHLLGSYKASPNRDLLHGQSQVLSGEFEGVRQQFPAAGDPRKQGGMVWVRRWKQHGKEADADLARQGVQDLVRDASRRFPLREICILTRLNEQCAMAAGWLQEIGVPFVTENSMLLGRQPVIAQIVSMLRFLDSPEDDVSLWTVLSGWAAGIFSGSGAPFSAGELERIAAQEAPGGCLASRFRRACPEAWEEKIEPLVQSAETGTPYDITLKILRCWRVFERFPGLRDILLRFLEVLHRAEEKGTADLPAFLDLWSRSENEEHVPLPEDMDAVQIMTIHKAKGLQRQVVILPWLDLTPRHPDGCEPCTFNGEEASPLAGYGRVRAITSVNAGMPDWDSRSLDGYREALHLLYVATTRAKSELYLFAPEPPEKNAPKFLTMLDELLKGPAASLAHSHDPDGTADGYVLVWGEKAMPDQGRAQAGDRAAGEAPAPWNGPQDDPLPGSERSLSIYGANVDDLGCWSPRRNGTFIHHCMECLHISGRGAAYDAMRAVERGAHSSPVPIPGKENVLRDAAQIIEWFASLPQARQWLEHGKPEQALLDDPKEDGMRRIRRMDLLVDEEDHFTAVEYKTNATAPLPKKAHVDQLKNYLRLLDRTKRKQRPARGVLVYLDSRQIFRIPEEGQA